MIEYFQIINLGFLERSKMSNKSIDFKHPKREYIIELTPEGEVNVTHSQFGPEGKRHTGPSFDNIESFKAWHENQPEFR